MDSVDPRFSFEMVDHPSDAAPGSMVREIHVDDGWAQTHVQKRDIISSNQNQVLTNQNPDSMNENVDVALAGPMDQSSYFEAASAVSTEPILTQARYNPEAFQRGGIHRRLQFEDPSNTVINQPAQSPSNSGGPESPFETPCTPIKGKETEKIEPLYPRSMNNTLNLPKPSGIGLHLNSIVNVLPSGSGAVVHVKSAQNCNFTIRGKKSTHTINSHLSDMSVFTPVENVSECMDDNEPEIHASKAVIKSSNNSVDDQTAQGNKRAYTEIENDVNSDEFKLNAEKRRKRSSDPSGGCKRCHCKKSKCLKLYCDCFAAGLYCAGSCACQGCYNRPEYENIVLESRQQIESRNPLAFAPKIVKDIVEPPATASSYEVIESSFTPSPARHKRGCNCKKSMCLKKYCECYHSNVGCSDGCRCEGCKNVYGQKAESGFDKDLLSKEGNGGLVHSKLTPPTPAIQLFKKDVQDFQSPKNSGGIISETVVDLTSSDQELYYDTAQTPNEYSNRYLKAVDLDGELSNTTQDDTPDILKESCAVKSSSPNKKRVSPPHASRHEIGLRSLNGLKTGRKFILKAVPSIPPVTPSVDSRRSVHQETDGPPQRLLPK